MTPAPVSNTMTIGGPPATGPGAPGAPASAADTDGQVDQGGGSSFEQILSKGHGDGGPRTHRGARHDKHDTGAPSEGLVSAAASAAAHDAAVTGDTPDGDEDASASSASSAGSKRAAATGVDGETHTWLDTLDLERTDGTSGTSGPGQSSGADAGDGDGATGTAADPSATVAGPDGLAGTQAGAVNGRDQGGIPGESLSTGAGPSLWADTTGATATGAAAAASGTLTPSGSTATTASLDNGVPVSSPVSASGFGAAPRPFDWRGAVPAATAPAAGSSGSASAPRESASANSAAPGPAAVASSASTTGGRSLPGFAIGGVAQEAHAVSDPVGTDGPSAAGDEDLGDQALDTTGLATSITGVLSRGDGNYNVVLNLHPPELGQLQARLSLRGDQLQVDLSPEHAAAHDALESALPALREHLGQGGLDVDVSLGERGAAPQGAPADGGGDQGSRSGAGGGGQSDAPDAAGAPTTATAPPLPGQADRLHLVL